jgi:hypothetical protein
MKREGDKVGQDLHSCRKSLILSFALCRWLLAFTLGVKTGSRHAEMAEDLGGLGSQGR